MGLRRTGKVYVTEEYEDIGYGCGCGSVVMVLIIGFILIKIMPVILQLLTFIIPLFIVGLILLWLSNLD